MEPETPLEPETPPEPSPRRDRIRSRTLRLFAVAAVVGVVGGTAAGYTVQADRPPTPFPALAQAGLAYPAKSLPRGQEPEPLAAKDDRRVRTDGDLRKLLVPKPAGARAERSLGRSEGWMDLPTYSLGYTKPGGLLKDLIGMDFRRIAGAEWTQGGFRRTSIRLVQFRSGVEHGAEEFASDQLTYLPDGEPLKGTGTGRYDVFAPEGGGPGMWRARAVFQRGDVMVEISLMDTKKISRSDIRSLAERQLERL